MTLLRLNLVGCGRVGKTLARLWHTHGVLEIQDVLTQSAATAQEAVAFIGSGRAVTDLAHMRPADLWMIGTQDQDISRTASQMAAHFAVLASQDQENRVYPSAGPMVFHGSGALGSGQLAPLQDLRWRAASAHCILSFANPDTAARQFSGTGCALEGDTAACTALRTAFTRIGAQCFEVAGTDKLLYHAAAVFATNFLPVLQSVAEDLWRKSGVPAPMIEALRAQLLTHAVANITTLGPQGALTGPAARGDLPAIARQGAAVSAWSAEAGAAYAALSALALQLAKAAPAKNA
jgi:predicted short-subunit dehydrogenase-like oxidoreductase (DUF2520 family)